MEAKILESAAKGGGVKARGKNYSAADRYRPDISLYTIYKQNAENKASFIPSPISGQLGQASLCLLVLYREKKGYKRGKAGDDSGCVSGRVGQPQGGAIA
jgi:hypothetical protein